MNVSHFPQVLLFELIPEPVGQQRASVLLRGQHHRQPPPSSCPYQSLQLQMALQHVPIEKQEGGQGLVLRGSIHLGPALSRS
jgi:hypothetical protein